MNKLLKNLLICFVCSIFLFSNSFVKAEESSETSSEPNLIALSPITEETTNKENITDEATTNKEAQTITEQDVNVTASDMGTDDPLLLPDSPFYFAKNLWRGIQNITTFNSVKKAELKLKFANEKIIEVQKLALKTQDSEKIKKAIENYQEEIEKIKERVDVLKEKGIKKNQKERVESFLDRLTDHQIKQQKIIDKLAEKVPEEVIEKIINAKERSIEKLAEISLKFEDPEKFKERLEKNIKNQTGSDFNHFKNLEILKEIEEKVPEEAKEAIQKAQANISEKLKENLENMGENEKNKLKYYIKNLTGNPIRHIEIIHNIESQEISEQLREEISKTKEKTFEAIEEKTEKFQNKEIKENLIKHLENGNIENIRIIKELENNLPQNTFDKIQEIKEKSLIHLKKIIENSDGPTLQEKIEKFHDIKQLEVIKELDEYISKDKKELWEQIKENHLNNIDKGIQGTKTEEERKIKIQMIAGDNTEHIKILEGYNFSPKILQEITKEQINKLNKKLDLIEDPEKLRILKETIEEEKIIKDKIKENLPNILNKINIKESEKLQNVQEEKAKEQLRKIQQEFKKLTEKISNIIQEIKNKLAANNEFQIHYELAKNRIQFAEKSFENKKYGESFGFSTSGINTINNCFKILEKILRQTTETENVACTMDWNPVCGADGNTYSNECTAKSKEIRIKSKGECKKEETKEEIQPINNILNSLGSFMAKVF